MAIERVAERVRFGGHSVPTETIKRRYQKSMVNFFTLYQPLANHWCFLDNSDKENPVLIAEGNQISNIIIHQEILWNHIQRLANEN
ncbi:MAG: hypothetical protein U9R57_05245 [Thermodesulfobacteriota bacterium]|nr:hypothetical protein [Thermodesulfobacteriota bacterium]